MSEIAKYASKLLARESKRAARGGKRAFFRDMKALERAFEDWALADEKLARLTKNKTSRDMLRAMKSGWGDLNPGATSLDDVMQRAMFAEKDIARQVKRLNVSRDRAAKLLRRVRTTFGKTDEGKALLEALRQPKGSFRMRPLNAGSEDFIKNVATFRPFGPDKPGGTLSFAPTRDVEADLETLGHELGHGLENLAKTLEHKGRPSRAEFLRLMQYLKDQGQLVPWRPQGGVVNRNLAAARWQRDVARTMDPAEMARAMRMELKAQGSTGMTPSARGQLVSTAGPHGSSVEAQTEEQMSDLVSALLNPQVRAELPIGTRLRLAKRFPHLFPEEVRRLREVAQRTGTRSPV